MYTGFFLVDLVLIDLTGRILIRSENQKGIKKYVVGTNIVSRMALLQVLLTSDGQ